tara:strand:- start:1756 stop:3144 length:1389 start_codon:yes stop_codon:yes gene_type:complete
MASTFSELGIELMATGENAGTWGTKTNANLNLVEQISGGYVEQSIAGGAQTTNLLVADGALTGKAQNRIIKLTGSITGNQVVTLPVNMENFYIINNATTDGSGTPTVQIKAISGSGATVTWGAGEKGFKILYSDGVATNTGVFDTGFSTSDGDVTLTGTQTLTNKTLTSPKIGTSILDTNGNELFKLTATSSAVNEITYANAATGNKPTFTASGNDTNIGIAITPKGSGAVVLDGLSYPTADGSADQVLSTNGSGVLSFVTTGGGYESVQVFTSSGTWNRPTGITKVRVIVTGGGGGGGGCPNSYINGAGQGGGAGGTAIETIDVSSTSSTPVTIGSGGGAEAGGSTSSFGPFCSGPGGGAGVNADSMANPPGGGGATGTGGDYNLRGGNGGGGSKGTVPNSRAGGFGGNSFLGGGGFGSCGNDGGAGNKGGGGGGASSNQPPTNRGGGAGGDGIVIVEEYK